MSKRRQPGDIVWKIENAGFCGTSGRGIIPIGSTAEVCGMCDDQDCNEWPDLWQVDSDGKPTGANWCHVSECQMEDDKCARGGQHGYRGCGTNEQEGGKTTLQRLKRTMRNHGWNETANALQDVDMVMREYAFTKDPLTQDAEQLARELRALVQEWTKGRCP
jgi:hypothetical protein